VTYLDRDGVRIYYESHGSGAAWPLLLSHGYSATADMWHPNIPVLSTDRQVITWDIRGHGRSDSPPDLALYSEALSVGDMEAILDASDVERAVVGGLSLGGYLSLAFNLAHPTRVAGLIICDAGPGYRKDGPRQEWNSMAAKRADVLDAKGLAALGGSTEVVATQHASAAGLALAARGILTQHDARVIESLPTISVPTLIVVGSEDRPFLAAADMMAAKIPGAVKAVIEGAGHASNIDAPGEFNAAVSAFLDRL
jgi:pimeloyl-ACP methyl ester carboxylesterase